MNDPKDEPADQQPPFEQGPELTPEDEAILHEVWMKLGEERRERDAKMEEKPAGEADAS